jgi:hypothetical protein
MFMSTTPVRACVKSEGQRVKPGEREIGRDGERKGDRGMGVHGREGERASVRASERQSEREREKDRLTARARKGGRQRERGGVGREREMEGVWQVRCKRGEQGGGETHDQHVRGEEQGRQPSVHAHASALSTHAPRTHIHTRESRSWRARVRRHTCIYTHLSIFPVSGSTILRATSEYHPSPVCTHADTHRHTQRDT